MSGVRCEQHSVTASAADLWSPLTARCTNKPNGCFGKSVIDSLLRAPWVPFAAPNAKRRTVLQSSDTNNSCSAPSTVCMSVVPSVLCALSSGEFAFEEKAFSGVSEGRTETCCDVSRNWFGVCVCLCELWVISGKGQHRVTVLEYKEKRRNGERE